MTQNRGSAVAAFCAVLAACAPAGQSGQTEQASSPGSRGVTAEGVVAVVGSDPMTQVVIQAQPGGDVALVGPLRAELANVTGLTVRVTGARGGAAPPVARSIEVAAYEIVSVRGERPFVGLLESRAGGMFLVDSEGSVSLAGVPDALATEIGAKVWIVGRMENGRLYVQAFGVIRRARRS